MSLHNTGITLLVRNAVAELPPSSLVSRKRKWLLARTWLKIALPITFMYSLAVMVTYSSYCTLASNSTL